MKQSPAANEQHIKARKYKVFISYRHADNRDTGRQWASWLHQTLETYDIPKDLVGKLNSHGEKIPERIFPVFRDEEELSADANLAGSIIIALDHSEHLIVICSPRAVQSTYVEEEIRYFKQIGKGDNIIAMMIDGEPHSTDIECFPQPLKFDRDANGQWVKAEAEPIAADFRIQNAHGIAAQGWTTPAAYRQALEESGGLSSKQIDAQIEAYKKQHELMKLKIISGVLDVPLGELSKRDHAYQMELAEKKARTLRRWLATVGLLALLAIGGGISAWLQKQEAVKQESIAMQNFSLQLTAKALEDLKEARVEEGLAGLIRSLYAAPDNKTSRDRLLFELAYRDWLVMQTHYPSPPPLQAVPGISIDSTVTAGEFNIAIESVDSNGTVKLKQTWILDTENGQLEINRIADGNGNSWQAQLPISTTHDDNNRNKLTLPGGRIIEWIPNGEIPLGMSDVGYYVGNEFNAMPVHGIGALSPGKNTLAIAGFYPDDIFQDNLVIRFFDTSTLQEIKPEHRVMIAKSADISELIWQGENLVLTTRLTGRRHIRIDIMRVEESKQQIKVETVLQNRIIPGDNWDYHQGKLYVLNQNGLSVYEPLAAAMRNWSAASYQNKQWHKLSLLGEENYSLNAWKKLAASNSQTGITASMKQEHSVILREASGQALRTIELSTVGNGEHIDYRGMGFSPDGKILTLVTQIIEGEGVIYSGWETYNPQNGLELFPPSPQVDTLAGPLMLRDILKALQLQNWSADGKVIKLSEWENSAYPLQDLNGAITSPLPNYWITNPQTQKRQFVLPLIWSEQPVPEWFLDTASQLIHLKQDEVRGLEYVNPANSGSFKQHIENVISHNKGDEQSHDYIKFLQRLIGNTP